MIKKLLAPQAIPHAFAPVNLLLHTLFATGVADLLENLLPTKGKGRNHKYPNSAVILHLFTFFLFGFKRMAQLADFVEQQNFTSPFYDTRLSYHTIKRLIKSYKHNRLKIGVLVNGKWKRLTAFQNPTLNGIYVPLMSALKLIDKNDEVFVDFDATAINSKTEGTSFHYLKKQGYQVLAVMANFIIVQYEFRTGKTSPKFDLLDIVVTTIKQLQKEGYKVVGVRCDSAGYNKELTDAFEELGLKYYIRCPKSKNVILTNMNPTLVSMGSKNILMAERRRKFGKYYSRRVYNNHNEEGRTFGIMTNDWNSTSIDIVRIYADRGNAEKTMANIKQMGWKTMVFQDMESNSTWVGFCMIIFMLFRFITTEYSEKLNGIAPDDFVKQLATMDTFRNRFLKCVGYYAKGKLHICNKNDRRMKYYNHLLAQYKLST